jgi:hypothetical protein
MLSRKSPFGTSTGLRRPDRGRAARVESTRPPERA